MCLCTRRYHRKMITMNDTVGDEIDTAGDSMLKTKCIKGHKFAVPRDKIQTSSSGKSFIAMCPKCNGVARLRREEVLKLFGVNPRDHAAVAKLYSDLAIGTTPATSNNSEVHTGVLPGNGSQFQFPASEPEPSPSQTRVQVAGRGVEEEETDDEDVEYIDCDGNCAECDEPDCEDRESEFEGEDGEESNHAEEVKETGGRRGGERTYKARVESAPDVTGKSKSVQRFRVGRDDDDAEIEEDTDDRHESRRDRSSRKVPKAHDHGRERERTRGASASRRQMRPNPIDLDEEEFDPNEVLKDIIDESGLDDTSIQRIFGYIDLQTDGWQPQAIQGVLQMYMSPAAAVKISQRYQAELYKEEKRRERERIMMGFIGAPSGNMRLSDTNMGMNSAPFNSPLRGDRMFPGMQYPQQFPQQPGAFREVPREFPPRDDYDPRFAPRREGFRSSGVSLDEVNRAIDVKLNNAVERITAAMTNAQRRDSEVSEARELRALVFDLIKAKTAPEIPPAQNPQVTEMMKSQNTMLDKLMSHALASATNKPPEDPYMKILLQELIGKKSTGATPPLGTTSEELSQRIQLQRLANDLELAQADFQDKREGRTFIRDIAGQALSKVGESVAAAWIESQRIQASASVAIAQAGGTGVGMAMAVPPSEVQQPESEAPAPETPEVPTDSNTFRTRGTPDETGEIHIKCPTCDADMIAHAGDLEILCPICGSKYRATMPQQQRAQKRVPASQPSPPPSEIHRGETADEKTLVPSRGAPFGSEPIRSNPEPETPGSEDEIEKPRDGAVSYYEQDAAIAEETTKREIPKHIL